MSVTDTVSIGDPLPRVRTVRPAGGLSVSVDWESGARAGRTDTIDLAPQILTFSMYRALRSDPALFESVAVQANGAAIEWDDGAIDISATVLERLAEVAMSNHDFAAFLKRNKISLDAAAALLGVSRRLVAYYVKDRPIPRYIALACESLERRGRAADELSIPALVDALTTKLADMKAEDDVALAGVTVPDFATLWPRPKSADAKRNADYEEAIRRIAGLTHRLPSPATGR